MNGPANITRVEATPGYAEIGITTNFSFLRGVSSCEELFAQAAGLELPALAITDRNSLAGIVRARRAANDPALVDDIDKARIA